MHTPQYQSSPRCWSMHSGLPHVTQTGGEIMTAPALRSAISRSSTTRGAGDLPSARITGRRAAAQPSPVDHHEQRGIAERRQLPLAPRARRLLHQAVGGVEEPLQLGAGQRAALRPALVFRGVRRGVSLVVRSATLISFATQVTYRVLPLVRAASSVSQ